LRADVILSLGYYDVPPCCGNTNPLPNPWAGSPNTTFLGDLGQATSGDPDESAALITNTGTTAITLNQGFSITTGSTVYRLWDSLIGASGLSIAPGGNVILSGTATQGLDGSDIGLIDSTITFTINGVTYSVVDNSCSSCAGNSILNGSNTGSADETEPWTVVDDIGSGPVAATPEPPSIALFGAGLLAIAFEITRRNRELRKQGI
jgi:hypothetical protein